MTTPSFYDDSVMMELSKRECAGSLVFLNSGRAASQDPASQDPASQDPASQDPASQDPDADEQSLTLPYSALTQTIIKQCFGVRIGHTGTSAFAAGQNAREAQRAIEEKAHNNEQLQCIAVHAYAEAFQAVINMHEELEALNIFTKCFRTNGIRRRTKASLQRAFAQLGQNVHNFGPYTPVYDAQVLPA